MTGPSFFQEKLVCQYTERMINSKGIFLGDDPLEFSLPLILAQGILILLLSKIIYYVIKPLGQGVISAQIIVSLLPLRKIFANSNPFSGNSENNETCGSNFIGSRLVLSWAPPF